MSDNWLFPKGTDLAKAIHWLGSEGRHDLKSPTKPFCWSISATAWPTAPSNSRLAMVMPPATGRGVTCAADPPPLVWLAQASTASAGLRR